MEGKSFLENISGLRDNLLKYLETNVSYYGLVAYEKAVKVITSLVTNSLIVLIMLLALVFLSGAAGLYFGHLLESYELGLLIVGGFYLLLGIVFIIFRKKIFSRYVIKSLGEVFFQNDETETKS
ncbi:MAG: hypothetical protein V2I46_08005 [Bacteroides sp.]|jgi:hypothetical protein|nr:hypothetical protein [Bacteroides sp.]